MFKLKVFYEILLIGIDLAGVEFFAIYGKF